MYLVEELSTLSKLQNNEKEIGSVDHILKNGVKQYNLFEVRGFLSHIEN